MRSGAGIACMSSFAKPCLDPCTPPNRSWCQSCTAGPPAFMRPRSSGQRPLPIGLPAADFSTAARLMEQTVEQFWVRGEAATMANWVLALPQPLVREHARLLLTTALYLLNTVAQTTGEQRARVHAEVQQLMARVETSSAGSGGRDQPRDRAHTPRLSNLLP